MNSSSFDQILRQVLIVPVVAVLLGAGALSWQMYQATKTVSQIERADETITQTEALEARVIDEETGLRGYQTTSDPRFLAPFTQASAQLSAEFDTLRGAYPDTVRKSAIEDVRHAHDTWQHGFAEPLIATIGAGGQTTDVDLNLLGKNQMDAVRKRIAALAVMARAQRDDEIRRWRHQVQVMLVALISLAIFIGLFIGLFTRRQLQEVSAAFRQSHNTLRLRAEQTFRSEQKLRATLQSIGEGVITCDAQGCIDSMNEVAQQLTGWTVTDARTRPLERVFNAVARTTRSQLESPFARVQRLNRVVNLGPHSILVRKDGSEIFIDTCGAPIRDKHGKLTGVVLVFRDITLSVKSQDALLANEKLAVAGRLAATIAHEIHNPLDAVSNLLFLLSGESTPEETRHFLELATHEIARVTQISRAMLSLHRESKAPVPINLKEMLDSILLLMDRRFTELGVAVTTDLPGDLTVHGFPAELRQVFTNLLTNAAEACAAHTPEGQPAGFDGAVQVAGRMCPAGPGGTGLRREAGAEITISDNGHGVPNDILDQLFKPFFTTKGERGTGLGLWVSRGIMTKHGGTIELASSTHPETHGTTVSVFLAADPVINPAGS